MTNLTQIQAEEIEQDGLSYKDLESLTKVLLEVYEEMTFKEFIEMEYGIK